MPSITFNSKDNIWMGKIVAMVLTFLYVSYYTGVGTILCCGTEGGKDPFS